jgi:hypothetical protein
MGRKGDNEWKARRTARTTGLPSLDFRSVTTQTASRAVLGDNYFREDFG